MSNQPENLCLVCPKNFRVGDPVATDQELQLGCNAGGTDVADCDVFYGVIWPWKV